MAELKVEGRAAVVTGAASGIGRALAMDAGRRGMHVALADVNADGLAETERMLNERQVRTLAQVVDVRDADAVDAFAVACFDRFDSVALVWANAGINIYNGAIHPDLAKWKTVLDVNLGGPLNCMAAFVHRMVDRAQPAQFVVTGSQASFVAAPEIGAYVASKHAVWGMVDCLRIELEQAGSPVGASMLAPPRVATPIVAVTAERHRARGGDEAAAGFLRSIMQPDEIAPIAMDAAIAREPLIVPGNEIADMMRPRVASLIGA